MSNRVLIDETICSPCRWIVFDAVGTLIHPNPSVAAAYHSIAARYGSQLSASEIGERFRRAFRQSETDSFPDGPPVQSAWLSSDAIEVARWRWIVGEVIPDVSDLERCFLELWDHFARPESWNCFDEVGSVLSTLRDRGFHLAIASNFDSRLHGVLKGHPALSSIERCFVSSETGYRKPALQFYTAMMNQLDCSASEILMIGDHAIHDLAGPISAGMQARLLDRNSQRLTARSIPSLQHINEVTK